MNYCSNCRHILLKDEGVASRQCPACHTSLVDGDAGTRECGLCRHEVSAKCHYCCLCGNALSALGTMEEALRILIKKP